MTQLLPRAPRVSASLIRRANADPLSRAHEKVAVQLQKAINHGSYIYAYNNIKTNQVVYSLSRSMKNSHAISQQPFAGKKTVPPALRKDLWTPFWVASFPSPRHGLEVFRRLREWKMLHELSWDRAKLPELEELERKDKGKPRDEDKDYRPRIGGPRDRMSDFKKRKSKMIMDQKENSIADLATVLLSYPEDAEAMKQQHALSHGDARSKLQARTIVVADRLRGLMLEGDRLEILKELNPVEEQFHQLNKKRRGAEQIRTFETVQKQYLGLKNRNDRIKALEKVITGKIAMVTSQIELAESQSDLDAVEGMLGIPSRASAPSSTVSSGSQGADGQAPSEEPVPLLAQDLQPAKEELLDRLAQLTQTIGPKSYPASSEIVDDLLATAAFNPRVEEVRRQRQKFGMGARLTDVELRALQEESEAADAAPPQSFTLEGVKIYWADRYDAEAAPLEPAKAPDGTVMKDRRPDWGGVVDHAPLGMFRHTAPQLDSEPRLKIEDRFTHDETGRYLPPAEVEALEQREAEEQLRLADEQTLQERRGEKERRRQQRKEARKQKNLRQQPLLTKITRGVNSFLGRFSPLKSVASEKKKQTA